MAPSEVEKEVKMMPMSQTARMISSASMMVMLGWTLPASAIPLRLSFSGIVEEVWADSDPYSEGSAVMLPALPGIGSVFTGYVEYESDVPDAYPDDPYMGTYNNAILAMSVTTGTEVWNFDIAGAQENRVQVQNDHPLIPYAPDLMEYFLFTEQAGPVVPDGALWTASLMLASTSALAWESDVNPMTLPSLSIFDFRDSLVVALSPRLGDPQFSYNWRGNLTELSLAAAQPTAVPEPSPLALAAIGLLGVGVFRRRSASQRRTAARRRELVLKKHL